MTTKKPAPAAKEPVASDAARPRVIESVTLTRIPMTEGKVSHPAAQFKGEAPAAGETIQFTLENGITYRGTVSEATTVGEEVLAEFRDSLKVVPAETT